jgi:hypothetical protein
VIRPGADEDPEQKEKLTRAGATTVAATLQEARDAIRPVIRAAGFPPKCEEKAAGNGAQEKQTATKS